ncbi:MAG: cytochrome-c oxidase, cbb3-type subunit III [Paracoccaceae bacterium]
MSKKPTTRKPDVGTTGHEWDGIEEYNNPLPRWWLWTFYATIIWSVGYTIAYPAWPLVQSSTAGLLGYSTRAEVAAEIERFDAANAGLEQKLAAADLATAKDDAELNQFAVSAGAAVFKTWCAQCHGSGASGAVGYPNLVDNDWLWGGDVEAIHQTVSYGIRATDNDETRYSEMPRFGADELLDEAQIGQVVNYVLQLSGQDHDAGLASEGATVFADNCAACHMEDGSGDRAQGAPNLADAIWLYGGSAEAITDSVVNARFGVMPSWTTRLSEADIRSVALYVHQLGGGE